MTAPVIDGRYELAAPLGSGGMGEVWSGYDKRLDRQVAVKLLRSSTLPTSADGETLTQRFVREARVTARLEHPGVPAVYDAGSEGDDLYLVMQLVTGHDLSDIIAERAPLPIGWAAAVGAQVSGVLAAAHSASLVHRDLKPRNLMLSPGGTVKVLDFGIAALLEPPDATRLTATGETVGTPAYMAPEQALSGVASPRSDLYALGCVLHELLCGESLFRADTALGLAHKHVTEPPRPLRQLRPDVPQDLERTVLDLLAKEPDERPADAWEVYARLLPHLPAPGEATADGADEPMDPTRPYRNPLAPRPRTGGPSRAPESEPVPQDSHTGDSAAVRRDIAAARQRAGELVDDGRVTQAAEVMLGAVEPAAAAYGQSHPHVLRLRLETADIWFLGGTYHRALPEYQRLTRELTSQHGAGNDVVLHCRRQAASCHAALGDTTEALRQFQTLLADQQQLLGSDDPETLELRHQVGLLLASSGDADAARGVLRELHTDQCRVLGDDHPETANVRELLTHLDRLNSDE